MAESAQWTVGNPGNSVSVITTTDNTVIATIAVANQPLGVAFSPDGTKAYVVNRLSNNVTVIDLRAPVTSVGQLRTKDGSPTCWPPLFHWSHKSV